MSLQTLDRFQLGNAKEAQALATHLRRVLRRGPDKYHNGFYSEVDRRVTVKGDEVRVYYSMEHKQLREWVTWRVAGFSVGWNVARKGLRWA